MLVATIVLFLALSAIFSGSEIAFISANKLSIELKKNKGGRRAKILTRFYDKPDNFLGTMLVGNNIALVVFSTLITLPIEQFLLRQFGVEAGGSQLFLSTIIITLIVLVFGEFLPKTLFRLYSTEVIYALSVPLRFIQWVLAPLTILMMSMTSFLMKSFFKEQLEEDDPTFTRTDLEKFVIDSKAEEDDEIDKKLFGRALNLVETRVRECMIHRTEIEAIDINDNVDDLVNKFVETHLSRLIVIDGDINSIKGYVHHSQLLEKPSSIKQILLEIELVPETMLVTDLMDSVIKNKVSIVGVVDEYGGISGIVTLEDMIEEIFGEIEDEHDKEEYTERQISENEFEFSGRLEVDYLNDKYGLNIPEGEYHTLSGYIVTQLQEIPQEEKEFPLGELNFKLIKLSDTKIDLVGIIKYEHKEV